MIVKFFWFFIFSIACQAVKVDIKEVPRSGNPSGYLSEGYPPRRRSKAQIVAYGEELYIQGGLPLDYRELWMFNITSKLWTMIDSDILSSRIGFGIFHCPLSGQILIFAGYSKAGMKNDMISYNKNTKQVINKKFTFVQQSGDSPSFRYNFGHCSLVMDDKEILAVYGGVTATDESNELFVFYVDTGTWTKIGEIGNGKSGLACDSTGFYLYSKGNLTYYNLSSNAFVTILIGPKTDSSSLLLLENKLLLIKDSQEVQDIQTIEFDLQEKTYEKKEIQVKSHSFAIGNLKNSIFIFGGYKSSGLSNELTEYNYMRSNFTVISSNLSTPPDRSYSTLTSMLGYHYLIGGENNEELFNDVWRTKVSSIDWKPVDYSGDFIKLSHHCSCIYTNTIIVFGGKSSFGLSRAFYQLTFEGKFSEISITGSRPTPRQSACIVANDSALFIFGGETSEGPSGELWIFDIGSSNISLLSTYTVGIAYHTCEFTSNVLKILYGKTSTGKYNEYMISINLNSTSFKWESSGPLPNPASSAIATVYGNKIVKFGGEYFGLALKEGEIYSLNEKKLKIKNATSFGLVGSAFTVFNKSIFTFGGKRSGLAVESTSSGVLSYLISIDELYCNKGSRRVGGICEECPAGTYSDKIDSEECVKCPAGTYNSLSLSHSYLFCMPCPFNTFGPETGLSSCYTCPSFSYCPVGASESKINYTASSITSINPELSTSSSQVDDLTLNIEMIFLALGVFLILLFLSSETLRRLVKQTDIFKQNHNETLNSPMILKKTEIGGCFTVLFVVAAFCLSIITLLYFFLENKSISQALVPLASILNDYPDISGDISFKISLKNFGGVCPTADLCRSSLSLIDFTYSSIDINCNQDKDDCNLSVFCYDCKLAAFPHLKMTIHQSRCFASSIEINITSDSGIQGQKSSTLVKIKPSEKEVLIGKGQSSVSIDVIFSVYEDTDKLNTGYYVLSSTEPEVGSAYFPSEVPFFNQLLLDISMNKQNSALLTLVSLKQATELIFTGLLGGITGILQIFSYLMDSTESVYNKVNQKLKSRNKVIKVSEKTDFIKNNFDWKSVLATKHTLWLTDSASLTVNNEVTVEDY